MAAIVVTAMMIIKRITIMTDTMTVLLAKAEVVAMRLHKGGMDVSMVVATNLRGSMSLAKSATRRGMPPKTNGGSFKMTMMIHMTIRRSTLYLMVWK
jgi:hypothetical protein